LTKEGAVAKKRKKLPGVVEKIIKSPGTDQPEKAQISIEGADELYKEIRIDNVMTDNKGKEARLTPGEQVDVTIEADSSATKNQETRHRPNENQKEK
jgi:type II secretory pathway component PulC